MDVVEQFSIYWVELDPTIREYPYRVHCFIAERDGEIATDQLRAIDKSRLKEKIGMLDESEISDLRSVFNQMFCV